MGTEAAEPSGGEPRRASLHSAGTPLSPRTNETAKNAREDAGGTAAAMALLTRSEQLEDELRFVERELYDLETSYLQDANQTGNVLRGFDAYLAVRSNLTSTKRPRRFQTEDRVFSLSSATSLAAEEGAALRDADGRFDGSLMPSGNLVAGPGSQSRNRHSMAFATGLSGTPSTGPGKPLTSQKRMRTGGSREGKKLRQAEQDESDDEDSQTSSFV